MKMQKTMLLSVTVLSLALVATLMSFESEQNHHQVLAEKSDIEISNSPASKIIDNLKVEFSAPSKIHATELAPIKMKVTDEKTGDPLTHVDWAISVKDPKGNIIYKTTTAHSHVGIMNFDVAFPVAGESTVTLTASSIGPKMMGMDVPGMARTHTLVSGDPMMGWQTDPENNFGSRVFEFPVNVLSQKQVRILDGTEPGTRINVELASTDEVVAGKPTTLIMTVTNAKDGSMVTHPDALISIRKGNFYASKSDEPGNPMMPMNGAYHGHLGQMTFTTTFPSAGNYIINTNLNSLPVSNLIFGTADARFNVLVSESTSSATLVDSTPDKNTVNIVGLESPFFIPNTINIKTGTTLTFVNTDGNMHTVTSVKSGSTEPDGIFDSGLLNAGKTFATTFDKAGTYEYFCSIHTNMRGTVNAS